jgi:hypothetical protein
MLSVYFVSVRVRPSRLEYTELDAEVVKHLDG